MEEGGGVTKVLRPASVVAHASAAKIKQFFKVNHLSRQSGIGGGQLIRLHGHSDYLQGNLVR